MLNCILFSQHLYCVQWQQSWIYSNNSHWKIDIWAFGVQTINQSGCCHCDTNRELLPDIQGCQGARLWRESLDSVAYIPYHTSSIAGCQSTTVAMAYTCFDTQGSAIDAYQLLAPHACSFSKSDFRSKWFSQSCSITYNCTKCEWLEK